MPFCYNLFRMTQCIRLSAAAERRRRPLVAFELMGMGMPVNGLESDEGTLASDAGTIPRLLSAH